ncbi:MAG: hypothetical protein AAF571_09950 [Verrucomicrobiota bacterium]
MNVFTGRPGLTAALLLTVGILILSTAPAKALIALTLNGEGDGQTYDYSAAQDDVLIVVDSSTNDSMIIIGPADPQYTLELRVEGGQAEFLTATRVKVTLIDNSMDRSQFTDCVFEGEIRSGGSVSDSVFQDTDFNPLNVEGDFRDNLISYDRANTFVADINSSGNPSSFSGTDFTYFANFVTPAVSLPPQIIITLLFDPNAIRIEQLGNGQIHIEFVGGDLREGTDLSTPVSSWPVVALPGGNSINSYYVTPQGDSHFYTMITGG